MKKGLIAATVGEAALLVGVLAAYLLVIAAALRRVSRALGQITFGVRAIERQTEPIGPTLSDINRALERVASGGGS